MTSAAHIVVVGTGQAGITAAEALRAGGFEGEITLIGDEPHAPYHRPPLSKAWLAGEVQAAQLTMRLPEVLAKKGIALRTGVRVESIDRAAQSLRLSDGQALRYTGLVLATGAVARRLPLPGAQAPNVLALRTRDDAEAIAARLAACREAGRPLVVIGGGFIGLEVAATARKLGVAVTVLEAAPRLLMRALVPALSDWFAALHRAHGVELVLDAAVESIECDAAGLAQAVSLRDGRRFACGAVVLGVGVQADDVLACAAGLACDRGVIVDEHGRTSDPLIVAAGDCTARRLADGSLLRLESVQAATEGAKAAAASLLGQARPFTAAPWFWSDQFGHKLQMAGLSSGADTSVTRGDPAAGPFSLWHFRDGVLVAVDTIDSSKDHLLARKLLDARVSPTPGQLADPAFEAASLLAPH
ncbi:NAD(P)/FAD-dependent oxidoreductase [Ideonella sp.]|uniref:NAD(P)/FAD-dependent oxidoreductase n=1 Tax=Ideonella sp. TaxID=1929293 RepID=UPI002B4732F7|nr:FAD-dependent oxidoreductase [Ideonella sp.]HJV70732.1 FAD-dependent oxidoreductase [Ideonella sp.]